MQLQKPKIYSGSCGQVGNLHKRENIQKHLKSYFDLKNAYETTWKYGIIKELHNLGLQGKI